MKTKFLGLALAGITFCGVPATGEPILSLAGPATPVAVGASFTIDVNISGVTDLASYQFDVGYNPSLVTGLAVEEGPFLPSAGSTLFIPGVIDDVSGTISFTAAALVGMGPGASGAGVLARLEFAGLAAGSVEFTLISPLLYDSIPNPIALTTNGTTVAVEETAVPEPVTPLLVICGLGLFALCRRSGGR